MCTTLHFPRQSEHAASQEALHHMAVAVREMKRKEGRDDACASAPSVRLFAGLPSLRPPSRRRRRRRSQALQREPTIRPSDGRKRVTHARRATTAPQQQQLEQQKQALWRLAQPAAEARKGQSQPAPDRMPKQVASWIISHL